MCSMYKPCTFSDNVKIMDWDNPDLAWAKLRDDWPMWPRFHNQQIQSKDYGKRVSTEV